MAAVPSIEAMVQQKLRNSQISSLGNPDMLDAAGTSFDDLYSLVDVRLGDGMTACVYAAVEKRTGRTLVCKLAEKRAKRGAWDRLSHLMRHESILLQQLVPHPNIVSMFGFFSSESRSAIMLDLVPGGDCQQLLQRRGALPESDVQAMITQLHAALSHLHSSGVLHRDVKLENVLCDTAVCPPSVKLCDLGHATLLHVIEKDRRFYGTPGYAAPEVTHGPMWSPAADVWSMGVVMYALLSNTLPFEAEDGWRSPADLSSKAWWKVSLDAKLLLQALLEPIVQERATLDTFARFSWPTLDLAAGQSQEATAHSAVRKTYSMNKFDFPEGSQLPKTASWNNFADSVARRDRSQRGAAATRPTRTGYIFQESSSFHVVPPTAMVVAVAADILWTSMK